LAAWATVKRNLTNSWHHKQWCELALDERISRLCVVAPRDHCKSEVFSVELPSHKTLYVPNHWTYIFSRTGPLADEILKRCVEAMREAEPEALRNPRKWNLKDKQLANGARITASGVGTSVRGGHPDLIICDDILDEKNSATDYQRKKVLTWFTGTVTPMAHPRTKIIVVGTPQHQLDLLMGYLQYNIEYLWLCYPAEIADELYEEYRSGRHIEIAMKERGLLSAEGDYHYA